MKNSLRDIIRLLRPRQWIKNFIIYAALLFSGQFFNFTLFITVTYGFFIFCALSSSIYIINDIFDAEKDRIHPFKKYRPIAHHDVSIRLAIILAIMLAFGSIILSYIVEPAFSLIAVVYFVLHLSYSVFLKHIEIIDILTLAAGYILRVFAGEVVSNTHISAWLFLTVISLSLFLAIGKRRSELTLLAHQSGAPLHTRKTLSHYTEKLLDIYLSIFATSTFLSYSLFTFLENPRGLQFNLTFFPADALGTYLQRKWLMVTIIPVVYGLMRYLQRIYEKHEGESPERLLFYDKPLLLSVVIWTVIVVLLIYSIKA
ncbi:MAG TPA: decaprenyl-phosphate phosphoribosyltransferase [Candidatus Sulfotelmatobacter sp.]|jgi:4-hydroxybenzoate polyprenyltransferase|nr:decaprenyl-phosphate phosphoribosyltransferase [Candidatus Sulfotelmatobacter sp.]